MNRELQEIIMGIQEHRDYLQLLMDQIDAGTFPKADPRIVVRIDDAKVLSRFSSVEALAEWLAKGWE